MNIERIPRAWAEFYEHSGGLNPPQSEHEYLQLIELLNHVVDNYDTSIEPYISLFGLLTSLAHDWELVHESELKNPDLEPFEMLAYLMADRGISQTRLADEVQIDQGNLSRILSGQRRISKELTKRLSGFFGVSTEVFM